MLGDFSGGPRGLVARIRPRTLLHAVEVALVVILALQAARLIWTFAAPPGPLGRPASASAAGPAADLSILARFDPFFRLGDGEAPGETASSDVASLQLFGVRVGPGGGSAIIGQPGGAQSSYGLGEEVAPGLRLERVATDHVILSRGGATSRLVFATPAGGILTPPPPPPAAGAAVSPAAASGLPPLAPADLMKAAAFTPRIQNGQVYGYRVVARDGGELLRRAGLQSGDVIIEVDGNAMSEQRFEELAQILAGGSEMQIRFERNGQVMTSRLGAANR